MRYVKAKIGKPICLGKAQENNSTTVLFDISQWRRDYTGGYITLIHQRPTDAGGSPVGGLTLNGDSAEWLVSSGDLQFAGSGLAELVLTVNGVIEKTVTYITQISESVSESGSTPPPPVEGYIQELIDAGNAVQAAVDSYNDMTAEATEGQAASAEIDHTGDHPVLKLVIPSGGGGGDVQSVNGKTGVVVLGASDVHALPDTTPIPPAVTVDSELSDSSVNPVQNKIIKAALDEQSETIGNLSTTVSGKYAKPSGGIPSTDMSQAVQTSLGKADTALQEHQDISGKQNKPAAAGTAGQVLGLDGSLLPVWVKREYAHDYELIVDTTLSESASEINITKDMDNRSFQVRDALIQIDLSAANATSYLRVFFKDENNNQKNFPTNENISSTAGTALYYTMRFGNYVITWGSMKDSEGATPWYKMFFYNKIHQAEYMTGFIFASYGEPIPSGTRIRIYGVRV